MTLLDVILVVPLLAAWLVWLDRPDRPDTD